jgi:hypothetical protein
MVVIVLVLSLVLVTYQNKKIPKIIWTYWSEDTLPYFIHKCIQTWYDKNTDYKIHILGERNLHMYFTTEEISVMNNWRFNDSPQKFSDIVRLGILSKHGGIWLDASIICYESFDWVHKENSECIVYHIPEFSKVPLIESWFIACTKNNQFIKYWRDEFMNVDRFFSISEYVITCNRESPKITLDIKYPEYLLIYICARRVHLRKEHNVKLLNATKGPYSYQTNGMQNICKATRHKFFKFRKEDRSKMTPEILECLFS